MIWRNKDESSLQSQAYQAIRKQIIYADLEPGRKYLKGTGGTSCYRPDSHSRSIDSTTSARTRVYDTSKWYVCFKINLVSAENARFVREQLEEQIMIECCSKLDTNTNSARNDFRRTRKAVKINDERAFPCR